MNEFTELRATIKTANTSQQHSPNWRTLPCDDCDDDIDQDSKKKISLFSHITKSPTDNEVSYHANWSEEAYQAALDQYDLFMSCSDSFIQPFVQDALHTLDQAYRLYGAYSVIGSFNGGKDAVVILELIRAAHANHFRNLRQTQVETTSVDIQPTRPRVIYFNNSLEFPEVYNFVQDTVENYDLDMIAFKEGVGFVGGLKMLVEENYLTPIDEDMQPCSVPMPHPMAFVLGTREADPNAGKQGAFAPSSSYMPPFMRVNPIIKWTYGHIWHFLRLYQLPYCSLYDDGYTSLGTVKDTLPCPALKKVHVEGDSPEYWPAYMLKDWQQERAGRIKKKKSDKSKSEDKKTSIREKSKQRDMDAISKCSTIASLPRYVTTPDTKQTCEDNTKAPTDAVDEIRNDDNSDVSSIDTMSNARQRTVGILIVGDEILNGMTPDTNTHAAAVALKEHNVPLSKVVVVSDNQDSIVSEIHNMQKEVDVIITSGGVGPTHDDVTIKSVAAALDCSMEINDEMATLLKTKMNDNKEDELTEAQVKMATLPSLSKLKYLSEVEGDWPVLQCSIIFILPGVPQFFQKKVEHVAKYLSTELERSVAFKVVLSIDEDAIVPILNSVVERNSLVSFGSYPFVDHPEYKTVVTLEGKRNLSELDDSMHDRGKIDMDIHVKVALSDLVHALPDESVLRVENSSNELTFI